MAVHYGLLPSQLDRITAEDFRSYLNHMRVEFIRDKIARRKNG